MTSSTGPASALPAGEVDHPVEVAEQRVHVVSDEQHRDPLHGAHALHERRDRGLVGEIEAVERLVEDQQRRSAHERLGDQQALLLAARELADRAAARTPSAPTSAITSATRPRSVRRARPSEPARAPPEAPQRRRPRGRAGRDRRRGCGSCGVERAALRQVADLRAATARAGGRAPRPSPRSSGSRPRIDLHQGRLARPVRSQHGHELPGAGPRGRRRRRSSGRRA